MSLEWWKAFFEIGGVVLLLLTFAFGAGALLVNNRLGAIQDAQLRQFDKDLTDAKTKLVGQQVLASDAAAKVAGLEQDAANAKTRAATAERSLLELQQRLAHRRIDKPTQDKLIGALRPFAGATVLVMKLGEAEAAAYADDVIAVLQGAGWVVRVSVAGVMSPPPYGLICKIDESTKAGRALAASFQKLPTAEVVPTTIGPSLVANIVVGYKPPA